MQLTSRKPGVQEDYETEEEVARTLTLTLEILNSHHIYYHQSGRLSFSCSPLVYGLSFVPLFISFFTLAPILILTRAITTTIILNIQAVHENFRDKHTRKERILKKSTPKNRLIFDVSASASKIVAPSKLRFTTEDSAKFVVVDGLFDGVDDGVLHAPKTEPMHTGVRA